MVAAVGGDGKLVLYGASGSAGRAPGNNPVATPAFSPAPGVYASVTVTISCATPGATIYYTIDGTTPTPSATILTNDAGTVTLTDDTGANKLTAGPTTGSAVYSTPLIVSGTETIQAIATAAGYAQSAVGSATYVISAGSALPFPMTQTVFVAGGFSNFGVQSWQQRNARYNIVFFMAYPGIEPLSGGNGTTFSAVMGYMKSYASTNLTSGHKLMTMLYQINNQVWLTPTTGGAWGPLKINTANANSNAYRLQASGYPGGSIVAGDVAGYGRCNDSSGCAKFVYNTVGSIPGPSSYVGGAGVNWSQWTAWYQIELLKKGNCTAMGETGPFAANANLDGITVDNMYLGARDQGDWQTSPVTQYPSANYGNNAGGAPTVGLLGQGWKDAVTMSRLVDPAVLLVGNSDAGTFYNTTIGEVIPATKQGLMDFVNVEAPVGQTYSYGVNKGLTFAQMLAASIIQEQQCNQGMLGMIYNMEGSGPGTSTHVWSGSDQSGWAASDWRGARYQLGLAHLLRWFCGTPSGNGNTWWFDEFDAGAGNLGWLGQPIGSRTVNSSGVYTPPNAAAVTAYGSGIITIPFAGGTVYLFPGGTNDSQGSTAVTLPTAALQGGGGHHIKYNNSPTNNTPPNVTSQAAFTSLYISPRDCIFTLP